MLLDVGPEYRWDREALFASGALTLTDLLEHVPGLTSLRAGWINGPEAASYLGDPGAVRIFYDGLEIDPLDPRVGAALDLSTIEIWTLEEVAIERGATELRVYLRSLRTERTTPQTRVDVSTGDEDTNLYRGFYGKRFRHGEVLQLGFQQFSTDNPRLRGGGDQISIVGRTGIARGKWSADVFVDRATRSRSSRRRVDGGADVPALDARYTTAYARAAYGDPERGGWAQLIAGTTDFRETSPHHEASGTTPADSADTTRSQAQYLAALGYSRGILHLSATERLRTYRGTLFNSASARASLDQRYVSLSLFGERDALDSVWRGEAMVRLRPVSFISLAVAASYVRADEETGRPRSTGLRGEGAIRVGGLWLGGGVIVRDTAVLRPPASLSADFVPVVTGRATGTFATVRGRVFKAIYADAFGVRWDDAGFYRPRDEARAELYLSTRWRRRFPSGNFGFRLGGVFDYRSNGFFPAVATDGTTLVAQTVAGSKVLSGLVEIRIVNAILSYQLRNSLGYQYQLVPGLEMPRTINFYGVRWEFAN